MYASKMVRRVSDTITLYISLYSVHTQLIRTLRTLLEAYFVDYTIFMWTSWLAGLSQNALKNVTIATDSGRNSIEF